MRIIPSEIRQLVLEAAPDFAQAVEHAEAKNRHNATQASLVLDLDIFKEDFMLLYACLWFAASADVAVTFQQKRRMTEHPRKKVGGKSNTDTDTQSTQTSAGTEAP